MDAAIFISILALITAVISLPFSYFVARKQVEISLNEQEKRRNLEAATVVADRLDLFYSTFNGLVQNLTGIPPNEVQERLEEINPFLREIDTSLFKSSVMKNLSTAIDEFILTGYGYFRHDTKMKQVLDSIKVNIEMGSSDKSIVTAQVIDICRKYPEIQTKLRSFDCSHHN